MSVIKCIITDIYRDKKDTIGIKLANKLMRFVACSVNAEVTYSEEDNG